MFKNLGLQTKIFFWVLLAVGVSFLALTLIVSGESFKMAQKDAFNLATETADKYSNEIRAELQGARVTAGTLATVFETLKDHNITDRQVMNDVLRRALVKKEYITAFCIAYDPDALDGKDANFAGKKDGGDIVLFKDQDGFTPYDASGRYAPYWNKLGGNIDVEALPAIDSEDWYIVPKTELREYITDPYPYGLQGKTVMLASFIFPITHRGKFIGIISSDIVLDKLQEMVSMVSPHGQDGVAEIISNSGAVVASPNKAYLSKDWAEVLAYEMLTSDHAKVGAAVRHANEYLAGRRVAADADEETAYENAKKFAAGLNEFSASFDAARLDLSLLNPEFALALLQADPQRLQEATEAKEATKKGVAYTAVSQDFYSVYLPVKFSDATRPWSVVVSIPMPKIIRAANAIRNYMLLAAVVAAGAIVVMLYFIMKSVTRPLLALSNAAKVLGDGDFEVEVPTIQSNDEIGTLSCAFKFMAEEIAKLITEMHNYAKILEEKNIYLDRLNELKDEFLANTSHELRTPLNGIIGIVESMVDGATGELTGKQKYNLAIVANCGKRLANMINDILDFTRLKNREIVLQIKPIDLKPIVDTVVTLSKPLIKGKDLTLVNEIDAAFPVIDADENRIQQILYNLIGNAVKFTDKGKVGITAKIAGDMAAISVADTGIGIPEYKFDRIFESFEQADGSTAREYGGAGLGLSITKKIVELHGGTIGVQSIVGEGSTFTFTVPVSAVKNGDAGLKPSASPVIDMEDFAAETAAAAADGDFRVLVVDDEPVNIQVLTNVLSMRRYAVRAAYNGVDALNLFARGETFDLVLLDVMMPKMSGYEVCRKLRETYSLFDLPIVMLTAKNQVQDIVLGFQSGANDYLQKPFDKEILLARVKTLIELKGAMTDALAANKAKSLFLANMSHEIRTPLHAVIGLTNLLLKTPMDATQRDYAEKMRRVSSTLLGIINDILDFAKIDAGKMTLQCAVFDLRKIFDDLTIFFHEQKASSPLALNFALDAALPSAVAGDPLRLQQVFINLVDNAYKFTERGAITVRAAVAHRGERDVMLTFAVEDTGVGMSPKQIDEIFAAFNQADNSYSRRYQGAGLGLTITKQMVELMGGKIGVVSVEGKGTTVTFTCSFSLPEAPATAAVAAPPEKNAAPTNADENAVLRGMRVLLVEDNEINTMIAVELLNAAGIETTTAENGAEALKKLAEAAANGAPPDLVLMDLQMPVMDGYEATKIILAMPEYRDLPIFALTAHDFPEERARSAARGMKKHLAKPIDTDLFYAALREVAAGKTPPK
ncbi:MAG: response regulator [Planctomycetota bacterium]|jgi:signal transduction histidine kinase|nr:response regulator [Planctomycetota bacterium]